MQLMERDDLYIPLLGRPAAAGLARTLISQRMEKWKKTDILDDALLVTSELVANAVEASPGLELRLRLSRDGRGVLLQVWDPSPGVPTARPPHELTVQEIDAAPGGAWEQGGGWGLPIVTALSAECGFRPTPPSGKWVWARLEG